MLFPTSELWEALYQFIQQTSWIEHITFRRLQLCKCGGQDLCEIAPLAKFTLQHGLQQVLHNMYVLKPSRQQNSNEIFSGRLPHQEIYKIV
jgi:hypothetical protein